MRTRQVVASRPEDKGSAGLLSKSPQDPRGAADPPAAGCEIAIRSMADIVTARRAGRELAIAAGFKDAEVTSIVSAISEVARNIVEYAHDGEVRVRRIQRGARQGLEIIAADNGPGIRDAGAVLQSGYAASGEGAMGLPRARWLMDTFEIFSKPGRGTTVAMVKWLP